MAYSNVINQGARAVINAPLSRGAGMIPFRKSYFSAALKHRSAWSDLIFMCNIYGALSRRRLCEVYVFPKEHS